MKASRSRRSRSLRKPKGGNDMDLKLVRKYKKAKYTIGKLYVDG